MEKELYELTTPQKSIWHTENFYSGTNINNVCGILTIKEPLNIEIFNKAIQLFIKNTDIYRTKLMMKDDKVVQYVEEYTPTKIEVLSVSSEEELVQLAEKMANTPLPILNSYLYEFKIFVLPNKHGGFIINNHHIAGDSWSLGIMANSIVNYYSILLNKNNITEGSNSITQRAQMPSYMDYVISEREYKSSKKFQKDKEYWNNLFATIPEVATIPSQYNNNDNSIQGNRKLFSIAPDLMTKISNYATKNRISLFNFFVAIYSIYLSRVSNLDDFCIGTPVLNRSNFTEKNTCGMFINLLPLRIKIDSNISFEDFASNIAESSMGLLRHQKYGYEAILEDLRLKEANLHSLYNLVVSYQITKITDNQEQTPHTSNWIFNHAVADDIDIHLFDLNDNNLNVAYDYKISKYTEEEIEKIHTRILYMIDQVLSGKIESLKAIEIVTPEERKELLIDFNNTKIAYPREKTIMQLFEEQVSKHGNEIALTFENESLTYNELNEKVNSLAHFLKINYNIKNGDIIGLLIDKSLEMVIGMLAILKAGAAFLPLDYELPEERLNYIIGNSSPCLILTNHKRSETAKALKVNYLAIDLDSSFIYDNKFNTQNLDISNTPEDLIYIIYTSGSTGKPKGVMVKQRNIVRLVKNPNFLTFKEHEVMVQTGTIVFDACIFEIFGALLNGFHLYVLAKDRLMDFSYMKNFIKEKKVSILFLTTGLLNELINEDPSIFATVRYLMTGGDIISPKHIAKVINSCPGIQIINCYGPTENGSYSTCYHVTGNEPNGIIPIGKPISNSTCYVVSKTHSLQPIGVPGELWVGGDGVARGYINNPDLTAQKFIDNPFGDGKVYQTGDLVKWLPDGNIVFLSRIDKQIKLRGYRIELEEIDTNILKHVGIKQSISILADVNNQKAICSYIVSDEKIDVDSVKLSLAKLLPDYMIPKYIIQINSIPLTISGKLDRKSLPLPSFEGEKIILARNEIDSSITKKVEEMLSLKQISINSSFFDMGGDSLSAISLSTYLSTKYNLQISVKDIFDHPVIKDLSDYISSKLTTETLNSCITKTENKEFYPTSSAQKRIYYVSNIDKSSLMYNIAGGLYFDVMPDCKKLENCIRLLINRHDALRTYFVLENKEIVQKILDSVDFTLPISKQGNKTVDQLFKEFVQPFDLSKAPLFKAELITLNDNRFLLLIDMHHIISDGASLSIFMKELCSLYNEKELPEKHIDYKDFAVWENEQFSTLNFKENEDFWINQFKDEIPVLTLPTKNARPTKQSYNGDNYIFEFDEDLASNIINLSKQNNITPYMLLLAVYYVVLSKYTSQQDIVVGTPVVNRETEELQNVLGMFVNSLPLRRKIDYSSTFLDFVNDVKEYCLEAFSHQSYPFDKLVSKLGIKRDISRNPIFDTMFIYQNNGYPELSFNGIKANYYISNLPISKFDLSLEIMPIDRKFSLRLEYCTDLFDKDFIKNFADHYTLVLKTVLKDLNKQISDIEICSPEEKSIILNDFNNTYVDYPRDKNIIELWEEQVKKSPNDTAIVFENSKLTYMELEEKSNQLANFLLEHNVEKGDIVAILMDKSLEMIVSILAILKVGAAYLPIDVQYPRERIEYMLRDSNAKVMLTVSEFIHKSTSNIVALQVELDSIIYKTKSKNSINIKYSPENLAYVMYTSGSTGNPKGVMIMHRNIVRLAKNNKFITFDKHERILQTGSIVFDACTFEIWCALLNGFELYIIKKEELLDTFLLQEYLSKNKITTLWITAPLFNQLSEDNPSMFKNVKKLLTGGDVLSPRHINKVRAANPNLTIINGYGPTENTTFSCCFTIDKTYDSSIPIGKPISNSTAYIVSPTGSLQPIGVPGELWVGGDGVGKGYLNNPSLTAEKFVPNSFGSGMIYKTGDLVKWRADGTIDFIGRMDGQVKIRGFRVELGEINLQISKFEGIKDSVTVVNTIRGDKVICNYFSADSKIDISALKAYLKNCLPSYMIPTYFMQLNKLPINANGKIDKKQLPTEFNNSVSTSSNFVAPRDKTEELLLSIFKKVLNYNEIGVTDNFFEFGGDSLTAMKVQVECLSHNLPIAYGDIFEFRTVENIANHIKTGNYATKKNDFIAEYTKYDKLIKGNKLDKSIELTYTPATDVLLTGFTGFLGAHVLDSFIKHETGNIYCLIRRKDNLSPEQRLKNVLHFYFGDSYDSLIGKRIHLVEGDITLHHLGLSEEEYKSLGNTLTTVIHCAALVKHYGDYSTFQKINIDGTQRIIDLCEEFHLRLLHVSTISVSGNNLAEGANIENYFGRDIIYDETNFYVGQNLKNAYVHSKFEAERRVLEAISRGVSACILRMGNLTSRFSEGKFQQNHFENAFVNRFKSFIQIGYIPDYMLDLYAEFTPIDYCGDAIIKIATYYNPHYNVFHLLNENHVDLDKLYNIMVKLGIPLKIVDDKEFKEILSKLLQDPVKKTYLEGIINDLNSDKKLVYESEVKIKSDFTKAVLEKMGFNWPIIDERYLRNYFKYLADIGYFNININ